MASEESINEFVSQSALKQLDELKAKIDAAAKSMEGLIADTEAYNKAIGGATNLKEYSAAVEKSKSSVSALEAATKRLEQAQSEEAQQIAVINAQTAALNKANRDAAKATLEQESAYNKLNEEYKEAAKLAKDLAAAQGLNTKASKEAATKAFELQARLKAIDKSVGDNRRNVGNYAESFKEAMAGAAPAVDKLKGSLGGVGNAFQSVSLAGGPWILALQAVILVITSLIGFLKTFSPLMDKIEQVTSAVSAATEILFNGFKDLVTGARSFKDVLFNLGGEMDNAAEQAAKLTKANQDLEDSMDIHQVASAMTQQLVSMYRTQAKDLSKSLAERQALLKKAEELEKNDFKVRQKDASDRLKIALKEAVNFRKLTVAEASKLAKESFAGNLRYAKDLEDLGKLDDAHVQKIKEAQLGLISVNQEGINRQESIVNKRNALIEKGIAKDEAAAAKATTLAAKAAEQRKADNEKALLEEQQFQEDMQAIRFANIEKAAEIEAKGIDLEKADRDKANAELLQAGEETFTSFIDQTKTGNELVAKINKDNREAQIEATKKFLLDSIGTVTSSIFSIITAGFDKQKNALQEQIDKSEELKNAEIDRIESSTASEEEKAARIAVVNAKAQADKERLEKKQKELDKKKAIADKQKAIFDIILNTAIAVVKALPNIFLAVATGVVGAAQLAAVLAQPIPKFAIGTNYSPEGLAYVGEKGQELVVTPSGKKLLTPNVSTLTYLEKGSKVIPNHKLNSMALDGLAGVSRFTSSSTNDFQVLAKATNDSAERITKAIKGQSGTIITEGGLYQQHIKAAKFANYIKRNLR